MKYTLTIAIALSVQTLACCAENLEQRFKEPPFEARPQAFWTWMSGNVSKEGITKDLETLHRVGLGGAAMFNFDGPQFSEKGPASYMGEVWIDHFEHALKEADRLGMELGMHLCDGWSVAGGPWIEPKDSMKQIVWSRTGAVGGRTVQLRLPQPPTALGYYEDVAVLATPGKRNPNAIQRHMREVHVKDGGVPANYSSDASHNSIRIKNMDGPYHRLIDGNPHTWSFIGYEPSESNPSYVRYHLDQPIEAEHFYLNMPYLRSSIRLPLTVILEHSEDGGEYRECFRKVIHETPRNQPTQRFDIPKTKARYFRIRFRLPEGSSALAIAECELLEAGERPFWDPALSEHGAKAVYAAKNPRMHQSPKEASAVAIPRESVLDLSDQLNDAGELEWEAPPGEWTVWRFGYTTSGMENHPASDAGRGLECDKMDPGALEIHLQNTLARLFPRFERYAGKSWSFILSDSWEAEFQNWTARFPEEFESRRGYSILPFLPVLGGALVNDIQDSEGFLHDFRLTIAELIEENFYGYLARRCQDYGLDLAAEVIYGGHSHPPVDTLNLYGITDIPMSEFWPIRGAHGTGEYCWRDYNRRADFKPAASAAHVYDKKIVQDEAFTVGRRLGNFSFTPRAIQHVGDWTFCSGVNRFMLHVVVHQPDDRKPGWTHRYNGINFQRNNPWFPHAGGFVDYLQRVQAVLQAGNPVVDVCRYQGAQMPVYPAPGFEQTQLPPGYKSDTCNTDTLLNRLHVKNGRLVLPGGVSYALLVFPDEPIVTLPVLIKLQQLLEAGARVLAPPPAGFSGRPLGPAQREEADRIIEALWGSFGGHGPYGKKVGEGYLSWGREMETELEAMRLAPDFAYSASVKPHVNFIHRKWGNVDYYFVANPEDVAKAGEYVFRVTGRTPQWWNPVTGKIHAIEDYRDDGARTAIAMNLGPSESRLIVFGASATPDGMPLKNVENPRESPAKLKNDWSIQFVDGYGAPASIEVEDLKSWTEFDDPGIRYYPGTARYRNEFHVSPELLETEMLWLDLGEVHQIAEVWINGRKVDNLWRSPYRSDIHAHVEAGWNQLEIKVVNTWVNRFIGDLRTEGPDYSEMMPGPQFWYEADSPLHKAGLIGPIRFILP